MKYIHDDHEGIWRTTKDGDEQLTNFDAEIVRETRLIDGKKTHTMLEIVGVLDGEELPPVEVSGADFPKMNWITDAWGIQAMLMPAASAEKHAAAAIQMRSKPQRQTIYTSTGWSELSKKDAYLHAGGAITAEGNDADVSVRLPNDLKRFNLQTNADPVRATKRTLDLAKIGPPEIMWPLIAATFRPAIGPADFAVHMAGRTGTFKSETASLMQAHYGNMDARTLPASWSSTANALEALCYRAANALIVVDDFVPFGTAWQVRALQKTADQLIRGQGNQSGRARLTDVSSMQETMYPRGLILSTGEDTPEPHSIRARMLIIELSPGDIIQGKLTEAQSHRQIYRATMARWIQWIAEKGVQAIRREHEEDAKYHRDRLKNVGHTRTPSMVGNMLATLELFFTFARSITAISDQQVSTLAPKAFDAVIHQAKMQAGYLTASDPVESFVEAIRQIFNARLGHVRGIGGGVPQGAEHLGWEPHQSQLGEMTGYTAHGTHIGWCDWSRDELYINADITMPLVKKFAGGKLAITKQTLLKRLRDSGVLTRTDETRQRNACRVKCDGHTRTVLVMSLTQTLDTEEIPNG